VLQKHDQFALLEAKPVTGRTHQIRVHLAETGCPVAGDELYGWERVKAPSRGRRKEALFSLKTEPRHLGSYETSKAPLMNLGLRAVRLAYADPFTRRRVDIQAPTKKFLQEYGFDLFQA
jgi:23S rRNA-/tRNA-specific pseudouridylate synthase